MVSVASHKNLLVQSDGGVGLQYKAVQCRSVNIALIYKQ